MRIPLPDGRYAHAQYLGLNQHYGTLIRVLDVITESEVAVEELAQAKDLFPPVFVGMNVSLRKKIWNVIGTLPVETDQFPVFRYSRDLLLSGLRAGYYQDWKLWDGAEFRERGELRPEDLHLECLCCWAGDLLEKRIGTGHNFCDEFR